MSLSSILPALERQASEPGAGSRSCRSNAGNSTASPNAGSVRHVQHIGQYRRMPEQQRQRAVAIVRRLLAGQADDPEADRLLAELQKIVPDPRVSDLIWWPDQHPLVDVGEVPLSAETVVEIAFRYEPFAL